MEGINYECVFIKCDIWVLSVFGIFIFCSNDSFGCCIIFLFGG